MKSNRFKIFAAVLAIVVFSFSACTEREQNATTAEVEATTWASQDMASIFTGAGLSLLNQKVPAPDFSLPLAGDTDETVALSDLEGRVVLLNFWASWCHNCRAEKPALQALHSFYADADVVVLGVNLRENPALVQSYMADHGITFPVALDTTGALGHVYGVHALPTSFIIDRDGYVVAGVLGGLNWNSNNVRAVFEYLLR